MSGHGANKAATVRKSYLMSAQEVIATRFALALAINSDNTPQSHKDAARAALARLT